MDETGAWDGEGGKLDLPPTFLQKLHTYPIHVLIYTNLANMDLSWGEVW